MKYNGTHIHHVNVNAEYVLLIAGMHEYNTPNEVATYQAYAVDQLTHRLWTTPRTLEQVERDFTNGRIINLDETITLTEEMMIDD